MSTIVLNKSSRFSSANHEMVSRLFFAVSLAVLFAVTASSYSRQEIPMTKADLFVGVQTARAQISDLDVAFSFVDTNGAENRLAYDHRRVVIKGDKFLSERTYHFGGENPKTAFTAGAYDGEIGIGYTGLTKTADLRHDANIPEIDTEGSGFFDLMLYFPCRAIRGVQPVAYELATLLQLGQTSVRATLESINGRPCNVIDVKHANGNVAITVWIDTERSFLPVRHDHFDSSGNLSIRFEMMDLGQGAPGVWLPTRGLRSTASNAAVTELSQPFGYLMEVDGIGQADQHLFVNVGVDDAIFSYANALPVGTKIADEQGQLTIVSGTDFRSAATAALAAVTPGSVNDRPENLSANHHRSVAPIFTDIGWIALMLLGAGIGFVIALPLRKKA